MTRLSLRTTNLSWREIGEEIVVLDLDGSEYFSVRGAGRVLWRLLAEGSTLSDLAGVLTARYNIDAETAARDAEAFVASLRGKHLVEDD